MSTDGRSGAGAFREHRLRSVISAPPVEGRATLRAAVVWQRALELANPFDEHDVFGDRFADVFDVLRAAGHDTTALTQALAFGRERVATRPTDFVARRAVWMLERSILFLGGRTAAVLPQVRPIRPGPATRRPLRSTA